MTYFRSLQGPGYDSDSDDYDIYQNSNRPATPPNFTPLQSNTCSVASNTLSTQSFLSSTIQQEVKESPLSTPGKVKPFKQDLGHFQLSEVRKYERYRGDISDFLVEQELGFKADEAYLIRENSNGQLFLSINLGGKIHHLLLKAPAKNQKTIQEWLQSSITRYVNIESFSFFLEVDDYKDVPVHDNTCFLYQTSPNNYMFILRYNDSLFKYQIKFDEERKVFILPSIKEEFFNIGAIVDLILPIMQNIFSLVSVNRLKKSPYFHGDMSGQDAIDLTTAEGVALLRNKTTTTNGDKGIPVITHNKKINGHCQTVIDASYQYKGDSYVPLIHGILIPCRDSRRSIALQVESHKSQEVANPIEIAVVQPEKPSQSAYDIIKAMTTNDFEQLMAKIDTSRKQGDMVVTFYKKDNKIEFANAIVAEILSNDDYFLLFQQAFEKYKSEPISENEKGTARTKVLYDCLRHLINRYLIQGFHKIQLLIALRKDLLVFLVQRRWEESKESSLRWGIIARDTDTPRHMERASTYEVIRDGNLLSVEETDDTTRANLEFRQFDSVTELDFNNKDRVWRKLDRMEVLRFARDYTPSRSDYEIYIKSLNYFEKTIKQYPTHPRRPTLNDEEMRTAFESRIKEVQARFAPKPQPAAPAAAASASAPQGKTAAEIELQRSLQASIKDNLTEYLKQIWDSAKARLSKEIRSLEEQMEKEASNTYLTDEERGKTRTNLREQQAKLKTLDDTRSFQLNAVCTKKLFATYGIDNEIDISKELTHGNMNKLYKRLAVKGGHVDKEGDEESLKEINNLRDKLNESWTKKSYIDPDRGLDVAYPLDPLPAVAAVPRERDRFNLYNFGGFERSSWLGRNISVMNNVSQNVFNRRSY